MQNGVLHQQKSIHTHAVATNPSNNYKFLIATPQHNAIQTLNAMLCTYQ